MSDVKQPINKQEYDELEAKIGEIKNYLKTESEKIADKVNGKKADLSLFKVKKRKLKKDEGKGYICNFTPKTDAGIYVFCSNKTEIKIPKNFDNVNYGAKLNEGNENANRCLYVGKSYDLKKRIKEHLSEKDKSPYSLKCSHPNREQLFTNSKVYIFELKDELVEHKELILPTIEGFLHEMLKPQIGTPRT